MTLIVRRTVVMYHADMWKAFCRVLSDLMWMLGLERIALRLLLMSLEDVPSAVIVDLKNEPPPHDIKVVYVDKDALAQLGAAYNNDFAPVRSILDVN